MVFAQLRDAREEHGSWERAWFDDPAIRVALVIVNGTVNHAGLVQWRRQARVPIAMGSAVWLMALNAVGGQVRMHPVLAADLVVGQTRECWKRVYVVGRGKEVARPSQRRNLILCPAVVVPEWTVELRRVEP